MVLIPLKDENPLRHIGFAVVTIALIVACVTTYLWQTSLGAEQTRYIFALGAIPAVINGTRLLPDGVALVPTEVTLLTSMFLHGSWLHLGGNMLFLWIFGDNIEDAMGHLRFLVFYLICGVIAALVHVFANASSELPTIGASGAVSGVLGAYLMLHPRAQILVLFLRFFLPIPAFVVLGLWFGLQVASVYLDTGSSEAGGVAWWAHIGGFFAGVLLVIPFRRRGVPLFDRGGQRAASAAVIRRLRTDFTPISRPRRGPWG